MIEKDRDYMFLGATTLSSLIAITPFSRDASYSSFFIYALLLVIIVFANRSQFKTVPIPSIVGLSVAMITILGSFLFNYVTGLYSGDTGFGLTDYVILVGGVFGLFYSLTHTLVRFGIILLALLRGATLALSVAYPWIFIGVSSFFVSLVLSISRILVADDIHQGPEPGLLIIGGAANYSYVGIGWACAGLEELILIAVLLYVLVYSFHLNNASSLLWMLFGIAGSFVVNIVRMVILVWVAYNRGIEDMLWVHTHLGDALFLIWILMFWLIFFKCAK